MNRATRRSLGRAALSAALLATACSLVHERAEERPMEGRAARDEGMLLYTIGRLTFEAPAGWRARGDAKHVLLVSPAEDARIDARLSEQTFDDDAKCLSQAEQSLAGGAAKLTNVRRHPTTFAGRKALVQEADQGGWHGWAWAMCDRGEQYRVFFTGRSPIDASAVRASRLLQSTASLATAPSAAVSRSGGSAVAMKEAR
jgi:hypothetical protein